MIISLNHLSLLAVSFVSSGGQECMDSMYRSLTTSWNFWDISLIHSSKVICSVFGICCVLDSWLLSRSPVLFLSSAFKPLFLWAPFVLGSSFASAHWLLEPPWVHSTKNLAGGRPRPLLNPNPGPRTYHLVRKILLVTLTWHVY